MALPKVETYDDAKLQELAEAIRIEQQKRFDVQLLIPQINALKQQYIEGGGDPAALED